MDSIASIITTTTLEKNKCQKLSATSGRRHRLQLGTMDEQFIDYRTNAMMYKLIEVLKVNILYFNKTIRSNCERFLCISKYICSTLICRFKYYRKLLARTIYTGNRQFDIIQELKKLSQAKMKKLCKSLPNRMVKIIRKNGGSTHCWIYKQYQFNCYLFEKFYFLRLLFYTCYLSITVTFDIIVVNNDIDN